MTTCVENVDVTGEDAPARLILNAMATFVSDEDFAAKFASKGKVCEVAMTVNGVPVPIVETLAEAWRRADAEIEDRARRRAIAMVTEAGLEPLAQALRDAEHSIREKLGIWDRD